MTTLLALFAAASALLGPPGGAAERERPLAVGFTNTTQNQPPVATGAQAAAAEAAVAPGGLMRFSIQWRLAQPRPGAPFDFARYESGVLEPALARGLRPLAVLSGAPEWAWGDEECDPVASGGRGYCLMPPGTDPESLEGWADFVAEVARRYGDDLAAIEIWNEQNAGGFWNTTDGPDAAHYATVLCTAYGAVREVDPDLPVIMGGLATSFETDPRHVSAPEFLDAVYALGEPDVRECMDGIGVHPYPHQERPDVIASPFLASLAAVRAVRDDRDDAGRPLWLTEFGYFTGGPSGVPEAGQAWGLACSVRLAAAMPDVEAFVIHDLIDRGPVSSAEGSYGVYRAPPGAAPPPPKPAAIALRLLLGDGPGAIDPAPPC